MVASARLLAATLLAWTACGEETPAPAASSDPPVASAKAETKPDDEPDDEPERPDEVACTEFVDHMEVLAAQSMGVAAKNLFTETERRAAVEHCKQYAHPNVVRCGRDVQVLPYFQNCLFFTGPERPQVEHPSREACEAYARRAGEITTVLQKRATGMAPPVLTTRQKDREIETCLRDFTTVEVECGTKADSQLALFSCYSPYLSEKPAWVTAEECEVYGDHMMSVLGSYLLAPYPKPVAADLALQQSGLYMYAQPNVQRFQLVNLCHTLDRELMDCHRKAKTAADFGQCVP